MKTNVRRPSETTHERARAYSVNQELELRRSLMACLLWEDQFYENGENIAARIEKLVPLVKPEVVSEIAIEAREKMKLRHAPLWIARHMAKLPEHKKLVAETLSRVIQRPDELTEFLSLYWKEKRQPLSAQVKKGLAKAFPKFNAYQLAKYDREGSVKLKDALFLSHAKPLTPEQGEMWKQLIAGTLPIPDTWEVALSAGGDKKETWTRLLAENKLGALALLRNLRNMTEAGVSDDAIAKALENMKTERVLPYRFIAAARFAPQFEPQLEAAMFKCLENHEKMAGHTVLLVDVSGSMDDRLSGKSEMTRLDAACGLAMLLREIAAKVDVVTFSNELKVVPPRRGFALRDAIVNSQPHSGTYLGKAVGAILKYDRLIAITDEQSHDAVPAPKGKGYMVNVASFKNGVGYGAWQHVDGWSEAIVDYIRIAEAGLEGKR